MKKQKVKSQKKGQDKIPEKQLNEVEIGNLPEHEREHDSGSWEKNGGKE